MISTAFPTKPNANLRPQCAATICNLHLRQDPSWISTAVSSTSSCLWFHSMLLVFSIYPIHSHQSPPPQYPLLVYMLLHCLFYPSFACRHAPIFPRSRSSPQSSFPTGSLHSTCFLTSHCTWICSLYFPLVIVSIPPHPCVKGQSGFAGMRSSGTSCGYQYDTKIYYLTPS